jgi:hypothetical protein
MDPIPCASIILVLADSNFVNLCKDPAEYIELLKQRIVEKREGEVAFYTVTGKYGVHHVDGSIPSLEVNDRNKTLFSQTLENNTMLFDELIVISINESDPFILAAKEVVTNVNKTSTQYRYQRK